jgi:pilus assembly protein FimV
VSRFFSIAIFAATLWLTASFSAHAAGLGRLTVSSALGQPLVAEIELVLGPGEDDGLAARLASAEAFRQAGIEPSPALSSIRFVVERRSGRPFLRLTSTQPINEPFLDLLIELQWNTGRLVREYTFLLDPPEYKAPQAVAAAPAPARPAEQPIAPAPEAKPAAPAPEAKPLPLATAPAGTYEVKKGDTLGNIARQHLPAGVSLNQMLIAIYRANQDAFIRDNINLVRAGRILNIPGDASSLSTDEANQVVKSHMSEFAEYRSRLASAPTPAETAPGQRAVEGRIEPKPAAKPAAPQGDQLRLSRADPAKPAASASRAARGDDSAARERALKEAQSRVADLEKNVADLQKLLELKNQQLAELEKKAAGAKPAPAAPAPAAPKPEAKAEAKPAPAAPKPEAKAETKPAPAPEKPKPEAAKPEAPKPAAPAPEAKKAEPKKDEKKAEPKKAEPAKAKPAPQPEPSVIDEFLDNPIALGGLAGVILLLVVYGIWAWRRKKATQAKFQDSVLGAAAGGAATFGGAAAATPSTMEAPAAVAAPAAEEVDPIAEADVYMAYGRDAQAEEILKEALAKDASRLPVHMKLLEIYANRKDAKSFEQTALKVKGLTNGDGPDWQKAASLGASIDPQNGLYGGATAAAPAAAAAAGAAAAAAPTLDFDIGGGGQAAAPTPDITLDAAPAAATPDAGLDFDIGGATTPGAPKEEKSDFTPEGTLIMGQEPAPPADSTVQGLDFDLNLGGQAPAAPEAPAAPAAPAAEPGGGLDFDLNLGGDAQPAPAAPAAEPSMDLSSISLDLGSPGEASAPGGGGGDPKWQEVATKLDLAKAYEEMGDKDGARELLNEVMKDGDAAQKGQAQQLLAKIA